MSEGRRLGLLGTFGFFVFWLVSTYAVVAALGYGFLSDLRFLNPKLGRFLPLESLERDYSRFRWPLSKLKTVRSDWRRMEGSLDMAVMEEVFSQTPTGLALGDPKKLTGEDGAKKAAGILQDRWPPTAQRIWLDWTSRPADLLPFPDPYGFPILPSASRETMAHFFPHLQFGSSKPHPSDVLFEFVGLEKESESLPVSFPLLWRMQAVASEMAQRRNGLKIYLVLVLVGMVLSGILLFARMPDFGEIQFLQIFGVVFGLVTLWSIPNFRTCYRSRSVSDAEEIEPVVVDQIKRDCQLYLEALTREKKLTVEQKFLLSQLVKRR